MWRYIGQDLDKNVWRAVCAGFFDIHYLSEK